MPKVKYLPSAKPKPNYLRALFSAYRKANGLNSEIVAERLHCAPETGRWQWAKPPRPGRSASSWNTATQWAFPSWRPWRGAVK